MQTKASPQEVTTQILYSSQRDDNLILFSPIQLLSYSTIKPIRLSANFPDQRHFLWPVTSSSILCTTDQRCRTSALEQVYTVYTKTCGILQPNELLRLLWDSREGKKEKQKQNTQE